MKRLDYSTLADVAEQIKLRDIAAYARLKRRDAALADEILAVVRALQQEIAAVPGDNLSGTLAMERFSALSERRIRENMAERQALIREMEDARLVAARAVGRAHAIATLKETERLEELRRRMRLQDNATPL